MEGLAASHGAVKDKHAALQATLTNAEELLQTLLTGLSSRGTSNSGGGYMGQLSEAETRLAQANAEEEQNRMKLGMSQTELKALEARWKEVEREAGEGKRNLQKMQAEVDDLKKKAAASGWSAEKEQAGEAALRAAKAEVRQLTEVSISFLFRFRLTFMSPFIGAGFD